jgi:6-phosphogluconate dehydrogenase
MRRAKELEEKGFNFVDVGTSGGIWGLKIGYSMMIGGKPDVFQQFDPIFNAFALRADMGTVAPRVQDTSSRWCITGSNTA